MAKTTRKYRFLLNYKSNTTGKPIRKRVIQKALEDLKKAKEQGEEFDGVVFETNTRFSPETKALLNQEHGFHIRTLEEIPLKDDDDE